MQTSKRALSLSILVLVVSCRHLPPPPPPPAPPAARLSRETGRSVLVKAEHEQPGYGLYSYMLFGSSGGLRERYIALARAWQGMLQDVGQYGDLGVPRSRLNITYFLLDAMPPSQPPPTPDWLVNHYNYTRARIFLDKLPGQRPGDGPYIVSVPTPLNDVGQVTGQFLLQDLSTVPPSLIGPWVKEFTIQVVS